MVSINSPSGEGGGKGLSLVGLVVGLVFPLILLQAKAGGVHNVLAVHSPKCFH